jgi:hypothetical protein
MMSEGMRVGQQLGRQAAERLLTKLKARGYTFK